MLLETLAAIHAVDTAAVGLDDLGRPVGFLARAVSGWRKRGVAALEEGTERLHAELGLWLESHLVPDGAPALLHNDFKLNNMILDPRDLSPVAVVDWDQGTRGDPLFDFATLLSYWVHEDDPPALHDMAQMPADEGGFWSREQAVATLRRAERTRCVGLPVPPRAGDVQAGRHLSATWLPLAQWRHDRAALCRPYRDRHRHRRVRPRDRPGTRILMDFSLSSELQELQQRTRSFIRDKIMPLEGDPRQTAHGPTEAFRRELVALGREAGLLAPHASAEFGGLGLNNVGKAVVFEEAGYSLLGPVAMHIFAPDEGNIHLLEAVATQEQKERWLRPLARGDIRSCFCMTEPAPGAGSDPSALNTTAVQDGNHWVINGTKWFITGAEGAGFAIIMAKGEDGAATMFLADMDQPGIEIVRTMHSLDQAFAGGHAVVRFNDLRVPAGDILGEPGKGFRYAQVRLAPARLTHCMRWLGAARRAHDIAADYAARREVFGAKLVNHEGVGFMLADNEIDIRMSRLSIWHTAWVLDQGARGTTESSIAKVFCSEAIWRVVDRCVQVLGGQGVTGETLVERIFREVRAFRIYDGPSEVHRWSLAQRIARQGANW